MTDREPLIVTFEADGADRLDLVGGKGANLARMTKARLPVPPGFVLTTGAYSSFMASNGLFDLIGRKLEGLDYENSDQVETVAADIRASIMGAKVPEAITSTLAKAYGELAQPAAYVAVRSSGTAEDLAEASFAGMHDTYLDIRGEAEVFDAVKRCWASLWTARATAYRKRMGFDHATARLAVVIQMMVEAEVAGVMFTANPMTSVTEEIVINASWGLGEAVVSGMVTPDMFVLLFNGLAVRERTLGTKTLRIARDTAKTSGTIAVDVAQADRARLSLDDDQLRTLGQLGKDVTEYYGRFPQDIEWALAGDTFYLLQSRPITGVNFAWSEDMETWQAGPDDDRYLWSRTWADETWTGTVTPLMYTWRAGLFTDGHFFQMRLWDMPELNAMRRWQYHKGTVYYNCLVEDEWTKKAWPPLRKYFLLHNSPDKIEEILNAPFDIWEYVRRHLRIKALAPDASIETWIPTQYKDYIANPEFIEKANGLNTAQVAELSDAALAQYVRDGIHMERTYFENMYIGFSLHARDTMGLLGWVLENWYDGPNKTPYADVLTGVPKRTATMVENAQLWELSEEIRKSDTLMAAFRACGDASFFTKIADSDDGKAFLAEYARFMHDWGHRGHSDRDIVYARRLEDPSLDYNALSVFLGSENSSDPAIREEMINQMREKSVAAIVDNMSTKPFGALKVNFFKILLGYVHEFIMYRDNERELADRVTLAIKRGFLEISKRLMARGLLQEDMDYFYLTVDELLGLLDSSDLTPLLAAKIAGRKRDCQRLAAKQYLPPKYMRGGKPVIFESEKIQLGDGEFQGIGTSGGSITGTARVIHSLKDIGRVNKGEILVVNSTDPGWTPVFILISGIVLETGGMLAHGSCLAREYGLPAVQVEGALDLIPDGATITIAGDTGRVKILG